MIKLHNLHRAGVIVIALAVLGASVYGADDPNAEEANLILKVATCQFPVSSDIRSNAEYIKKFIKEAASEKADIIHFSEAALSGYPGRDFRSFKDYNWEQLKSETYEIMSVAKQNNIWVILGSSHYISRGEKPTNCLYIISNSGRIVDRYDKSMLTDLDSRSYTPGNHRTTLTLKGIKCGFLICYDSSYPEMYNIYRHKGVKIMFHSFHNARHKGPTILDEITPAYLRVRAADNVMWVIANNSSTPHSSWPTCIVGPDGSIADSLQRNVPGILYHQFPDNKLSRKSWLHNKKMMKLPEDEVYYRGGKPSNHPRAIDTKSLP